MPNVIPGLDLVQIRNQGGLGAIEAETVTGPD